MAGADEVGKMIDFLAERARLRPEAAPINPETAVPNGPPPISKDPWFNMLGPPAEGASNHRFYIWGENQGRRVRIDGPFTSETEAQKQLNLMKPHAKNMTLSVGPMP